MVTRWLSYIRLFDLDVKHIDGKKNEAADGLSRRGRNENDGEEEDPDDYFEAILSRIIAGRTRSNGDINWRVCLHEAEYSGDDLIHGRYLETLRKREGMSDGQYQQLRKKSRQFFVRDGHLFKRTKKGLPPRRVIKLEELKLKIMNGMHNEIGHRGQQMTYQ